MSSPDTATLWLETLHRICGRAAHEVKGVLNAVSVNLEVVRSRAARPETPASAIASYANAAAEQFDAVIDMTEGLLFLSRPGATPVDVGMTVARIGALLGPVARVDGKTLVIDGSVASLGSVDADPTAVRLAIGASMLGAIEAGTSVICRARGSSLEVTVEGGEAAPVGDVVASAVKGAGIELQAERSAMTITFPR